MSLEAFALALPSIRHGAADIAAATGADVSFIADKVGVNERFVLGPGETGVGLAAAACRNLFEHQDGLREQVDLVVCVTQNPDRRIPHNAPAIADALGLPAHVASFDISLGCSGFAMGVEIVEGFLARCGLDNAVLVTCDPYSRVIAPEDRDTNCVFGDAATATWVRASGRRTTTLARDFGTDGAGADAIAIAAGGASRPLVGSNGSDLPARDELRLRMHGRKVYNFVLDRIPASIDACLRRAGCGVQDVDLFVLHPGSAFMLQALVQRAGLPPDRVPSTMGRHGNAVSSSLPLLLAELDAAGRLGGRLVLMSGFGVGLSWATLLVRFH